MIPLAARSLRLHRQIPPQVQAIVGAGHLEWEADFSQPIKRMVGSPGAQQYGSYFFGEDRNWPNPSTGLPASDERADRLQSPEFAWWSGSRAGTTNHNVPHRGALVHGLRNPDNGAPTYTPWTIEAQATPTFDLIAMCPGIPELDPYALVNGMLRIRSAVMSPRVKALQYIGGPAIVSNGSGHTPNSTFVGTMAGGVQHGTLAPGLTQADNVTTLTCSVDGAGNVSFPNSVLTATPYLTIARYSTMPSGTVAVTGGTGTGLTVSAPYIAGIADFISGRISTSRHTVRRGYHEVCGQMPSDQGGWFARWFLSTCAGEIVSGKGTEYEYDIPEVVVGGGLTPGMHQYHSHPSGTGGVVTEADASTGLRVWGFDLDDHRADVYFAASETAARVKVYSLPLSARLVNSPKEMIFENSINGGGTWGAAPLSSFVESFTFIKWARSYRSQRHGWH